MFGANLRRLASKHPTVVGLTRELGINRTQFNRYLAGESFPRPDVLDRICRFFGVDARILLQPVDEIPVAGHVLTGEFLHDYLGAGVTDLSKETFPSGFFRYLRRCHPDTSNYAEELLYVLRRGACTFVRGYVSSDPESGAPAEEREVRGYVSRLGDGICLHAARHSAKDGFFVLAKPALSETGQFWAGHVIRSTDHEPPMRAALEHLGHDLGAALAVTRRAGIAPVEQLTDPHRHLLRLDTATA
ncbi:hypothetical protein AVO45_07115 [Ruegeria marisrubri]|uniref:HTH cro/C1-type domain-containing protein n=2 Tax=Ruegeria marisrubri TaxID=1685379 RepID=A0A0X3TZ12_9RHOB|nr:hypothetical protein AVO45_07115 [Ruegeria marisrubri]